jgi:hypothetical protein
MTVGETLAHCGRRNWFEGMSRQVYFARLRHVTGYPRAGSDASRAHRVVSVRAGKELYSTI